jgi:hypothetical protein
MPRTSNELQAFPAFTRRQPCTCKGYIVIVTCPLKTNNGGYSDTSLLWRTYFLQMTTEQRKQV